MKRKHQLDEKRKQRTLDRMNNDDKWFGGVAITVLLINLVWVAFLMWAIYRVVVYFTG